jgi:hypothetical protein
MRIGPFLRIVTLAGMLLMVALAQQASKEDILLARARHHMAETLRNLPNYTCTQTIERMERRPPAKRIELIDMLRLEVALVSGRELYKWPGSGTFESAELRDLIKTGATGTGQFAGYVSVLFATRAPRFEYAGEELRNGRRLVRWDYVVPRNLSGFNLRVEPHEVIVGFHGSIWIDAESLDLKRLEVYADDIPPILQLSDAITLVEYERARIGTGEFLLPSMSELRMVDLNGGSSINRAKFSRCRQYTGESVVTFEDPAEEGPAAEPVQTLQAPAGISLDLELETEITDKTSAVGDPITLVLKKDAKQGRTIMAPKGATAHGRITFLRKHNRGRQQGFLLGLDVMELEFGNTRVAVTAELEPMALVSVEQGIIFRPGYTLRLGRGTRMYWRTRGPRKE